MERMLNKEIKEIQISESCLDNLNKMIETYVVNCRVLFIVDFLTLKKYSNKLEEIKKCSLNNIEIKVLYNNKVCENEINNFLDESFALIVGIGDFSTLKFVNMYAIKNNINFALVNLFSLKCEIFTNFLSNFNEKDKNFPIFVLINKIYLNDEEKFNMFLNIFKYNYILFESENLELKTKYKDILSCLNSSNITEKLVEVGKILKEYNVNFFVKNCFNEFKNFLYSQCLLLIYKNILKKINLNNLDKIKAIKLNKSADFFEYLNFDFKFNKYYLILNKESLLDKIEELINLNKNLIQFLKNINFPIFYKNCLLNKKFSLRKLKKEDFNATFLNKMKYFEIFNNSFKLFA